MTLTSCHLDPARALVPVLQRLTAGGVPLGDVLADSGYAHRTADGWAIPLRAAGAALIQDLHPDDRGPRGTHHGAIIANGTLYCPATPRPLLGLGPLARDATPDQTAAHDQQTAETARCKPGKITSDDADGYHRVMCPAVLGKLRCPLRPRSMALDRQRPEILTPPGHPPACCTQQTITVPPEVSSQDDAKTRLPLQGTPAVLRPPHRRRADLLHRQRPGQQRHQPRLVPPHGPDRDHLVHREPAHRPQPADHGRLDRPPGPRRTARRHRAPAQHPPPPPRNPRQPHCRAPIISTPSRPGPSTALLASTTPPPQSCAPSTRQTSLLAPHSHPAQQKQDHPRAGRQAGFPRTRLSAANVKIVPGET